MKAIKKLTALGLAGSMFFSTGINNFSAAPEVENGILGIKRDTCMSLITKIIKKNPFNYLAKIRNLIGISGESVSWTNHLHFGLAMNQLLTPNQFNFYAEKIAENFNTPEELLEEVKKCIGKLRKILYPTYYWSYANLDKGIVIPRVLSVSNDWPPDYKFYYEGNEENDYTYSKEQPLENIDENIFISYVQDRNFYRLKTTEVPELKIISIIGGAINQNLWKYLLDLKDLKSNYKNSKKWKTPYDSYLWGIEDFLRNIYQLFDSNRNFKLETFCYETRTIAGPYVYWLVFCYMKFIGLRVLYLNDPKISERTQENDKTLIEIIALTLVLIQTLCCINDDIATFNTSLIDKFKISDDNIKLIKRYFPNIILEPSCLIKKYSDMIKKINNKLRQEKTKK